MSKVIENTLHGWKSKPTDSVLTAYYTRRNELSVENDCLMWGSRVIVPQKLRARILEELHEGHIDVVKMKNLSRSYVWWPGLNSDIEQMAKQCCGCQSNQNTPEKAFLHPWEWPSKPMDRVQIDFAGPFMGHMFFVMVDVHSKWPEVELMNTTTASKTVDILRTLCGHFGVPKQIVTMEVNSTLIYFKHFVRTMESCIKQQQYTIRVPMD